MEVPIRVNAIDGVVDDIAVAVMALGVINVGDKWIGADESRKLWIIVPAAIVVEARFGIKNMAGEAAEGIPSAFLPGNFTPGVILDELSKRSAGTGDDIDPAEVVIVVEKLLSRGLLRAP